MLGDEVVAHQALVTALIPTVFLNLVLAFPAHRLVRKVLGERLVLAPAAEAVLRIGWGSFFRRIGPLLTNKLPACRH